MSTNAKRPMHIHTYIKLNLVEANSQPTINSASVTTKLSLVSPRLQERSIKSVKLATAETTKEEGTLSHHSLGLHIRLCLKECLWWSLVTHRGAAELMVVQSCNLRLGGVGTFQESSNHVFCT
jgi:hypothetical protein